MLMLAIMNIKSHMTLTTDAEITAFLHRTRMAILETVKERPATASQIAATLGVHPANLTRHIRHLKDAGLITLVEKRDTGRNLEKYYLAAASSFDVAPEADNLKASHKIGLAFARSDLSAALALVPDHEMRPVVSLVKSARIALKDIGHLQQAITALVDSFSSKEQEDGESYHLNISLYPSFVEEPPDKQIELVRKREMK